MRRALAVRMVCIMEINTGAEVGTRDFHYFVAEIAVVVVVVIVSIRYCDK